ncbi:unnamed protein product [Symbiodinium natans]|uniref:Pseudouridine synthase RsuA/RluA-like domain-containing protein n=1 Tax=Symbiodinium natans TaxID=878477 RepID=A0A812JN19_9DINO|nr:unnamed protein product [Symbiodinium natans]
MAAAIPTMQRRGDAPTGLRDWNLLIRSRGRERAWTEALGMLDDLPAQRLEPDKSTCSILLRVCSEASRWQASIQLLSEWADSHRELDVVCFNAAVIACKCGSQWQSALNALASMPEYRAAADAVTYASVISACEKACQWEVALCLFSDMPGHRVRPDAVACSGALRAIAEGRQWATAFGLLWELISYMVEVNTFAFSSTLKSLEGSGHWDLALHTLEEMEQWSLGKDLVSYNTAMTACETSGQWQAALALVQALVNSSVAPDKFSYGALLRASAAGLQWQLSCALLAEERSLRSDNYCCSAAMVACAECEEWSSALALLTELRRSGASLDKVSYSAAIGACGRGSLWRLAVSLVASMMRRKLTPDGVHVGDAVSCVRQARGEDAALDYLLTLRRPWGALLDMPSSRAVVKVPSLVWEPPFLAVLKPAGTATEEFLRRLAVELAPPATPPMSIATPSRLDHPTSGVLPVALGTGGSFAPNWLISQFAARLVKKEYVCLCEGPELGEVGEVGSISTPLLTEEVGKALVTRVSPEGREARTLYEVVDSYPLPPPASADQRLTLLKIRLLTGRTHQIRVHLASIGQPLVGDRTYGNRQGFPCARMFLHCRKVSFRNFEGKVLEAVAQLPHELQELLVYQMIGNYGALSMTCSELFGHDAVPPEQASSCLISMLDRRELPPMLMDAMASAMEDPDQLSAIFGPVLNQVCQRLKGRNLVDQKLEVGKRKAFQPCDDVDPSLKLVRSASANLAKQTGRPRAVARAALDALGEDRDQACRLLLSGLALAVLDSEPCEVELLAKGIPAWLKDEADDPSPPILSVGAFDGCFLLRVQKHRQEPLRLFALEPVDVCLLSAKTVTVDEAPRGSV